jgi:hypothetical protein
MSTEHRDRAAACLRLANDASNPLRRALLLEMAQVWMRLHDQAEKNSQADLVSPVASPSGNNEIHAD